MKKYLGVKVVSATPQFKCIRDVARSNEDAEVLYLENVDDVENNLYKINDGYKVIYEDGYISWSPKDVFEKAYKEVGNYNSLILDANTITGEWKVYDSGDCCDDCCDNTCE